MSTLNYIIWSQDPEIFRIPLSILGWEDRPIVWYGLLFALGFILSQQVMYHIFKVEGKPVKDVDTLTTYMVVAVIVGARLGHCLFYDPVYFLSNPLEILKVYEGGLASHGGALGILIALYIFVRKMKGYTWFWMVDRLVIVCALTGALIRTGNLMNSEMEGIETNSDYGLVYARGTEDVLKFDDEKVASVSFEKGGKAESDVPGRYPVTAIVEFKEGVTFGSEQDKRFVEYNIRRSLLGYSEVVQHIDFGGNTLNYEIKQSGGRSILEIYGVGIVRHPAQMYEAFYCLLLMVLLYWLWANKRQVLPVGFMFSLFMMLLWSLRFFDEFFKMDQEAFEADLPLNMGQWLSIPLFLMGLGVMIYAYRRKSADSGGS